MKIIDNISDLDDVKKGCVLTIGNFDGVHLGHQQILTAAGQIAVEKKTELTVLTFEPHPLAVLHPQETFGVLTPLELKKHLLAEFGVDCLFVLKSTRQLLRLSPQDFVEQFIVENIKPGIVVEGQSFNFGSGRTGGVHTLQKLGDEKGFEVSVIDAREVKLSTGQAVKISSTIIRNMLEDGKVADAAVALSRPYRLIGKIIPGRGKGTRLGFPTVNMQKLQQIIPAEAVYAGRVEVGDSQQQVCSVRDKLPAVFSIGRTGTYGTDQPLLIEAHLLMENVGDLLDKWLAMDFIEHLRSQVKFDSEKELANQIAKDCKKAKKFLKGGIEKD